MMKFTMVTVLALFSVNCVAEQLADPTRPTTTHSSSKVELESTENSTTEQIYSSDKLILNSTIVALGHKVAIINGVQLKIGDDINGAIIRRITHQQVELQQQDGEIVTLSLQKSFVSEMKSTP